MKPYVFYYGLILEVEKFLGRRIRLFVVKLILDEEKG
jgi:hypothetical protein